MTEVQRSIAPNTLIICPHYADYRPIGDVADEASVERCSLPGKPCPHFDDCLSLKQSAIAGQS